VRYVGSVGFLLVAWWVSVGTVLNPNLIPAPDVVAAKVADMLGSGELLAHVGASLRRVLIGDLLGSASGILIGMAIGLNRTAEDVLEPPLQFVRNITPVAIVPFAIHAFGLEEASKYFVIWYASVIPVAFNTATGVLSTPVIRIRAAQCLGARRRDILFRIVLPSAWPFVVTGLRIALGFAFMGVVAAEMVAADTGVGFLIMQSRNMLLPEQMFVGLIMLGLIGLAADRVFRLAVTHAMRRYLLSGSAAIGEGQGIA
jgi:ABC-type nitrate/sulfonate/bicarbonate transport system permease component